MNAYEAINKYSLIKPAANIEPELQIDSDLLPLIPNQCLNEKATSHGTKWMQRFNEAEDFFLYDSSFHYFV